MQEGLQRVGCGEGVASQQPPARLPHVFEFLGVGWVGFVPPSPMLSPPLLLLGHTPVTTLPPRLLEKLRLVSVEVGSPVVWAGGCWGMCVRGCAGGWACANIWLADVVGGFGEGSGKTPGQGVCVCSTPPFCCCHHSPSHAPIATRHVERKVVVMGRWGWGTATLPPFAWRV